jgi:hypothetical protein
MLGSFHRPVKLSIWAEAIPSNKLERYNSLSELSIQASSIVGPLIASFFLMNKWTNFGFAIDALSFFVCATMFVQILTDEKNTDRIYEKTSTKDFLRGFSIIIKQKEIFKFVSYDAIQMIGFGAFNATFLVLAQRDFGWTKADYTYHLSIVALFTTIGAFMGATRPVEKLDHIAKLITCGLLCAITLSAVLALESFPMCSILVGICDGLSVLTMAVTRTKVQLIAKHDHPDCLSSIIAARFIIIKAATLLGIGACLVVDDFLSLKATLTIFITPIFLSIVPLFVGSKEMVSGKILSSTENS